MICVWGFLKEAKHSITFGQQSYIHDHVITVKHCVHAYVVKLAHSYITWRFSQLMNVRMISWTKMKVYSLKSFKYYYFHTYTYCFASKDIDGHLGYYCVHFTWFLKSQLWGFHPLALYGLAEIKCVFFYIILSLSLCSTEEINSSGMEWWWYDERFFIFGWRIFLRLRKCIKK